MSRAKAHQAEALPTSATATSVVLRPVADAAMGVFALVAALFVTLLLGVRAAPGVAAQYDHLLVVQGPILIVLTICVYAAWGLYGRVRFLPAREKMLNLFGAATFAFAGVGLVQALLPADVRLGPPMLAWTWALAVAFLLGSRYWSGIWRTLALTEAGVREPDQPVTLDGRRAKERVLVIGGAGYIGSALLPKLLDRGYKVRVLDVLLFGDEPIGDVLDHPDLELVKADFREVDRVVAAMEGVDAVVHLGGLVGDPACSVDEDLTTEVNLDFTRLIAEVAKGAGVERFVFASSCSVYGASDDLLNEESALNPVSLYARSKIASENVLFEMADETFAPTMLRFATVYGLSGRTRFDLVVNLLSAKAVVDGEITVFGGDQWRPFVHVDDVAQAVATVVAAPVEKVRNEVFNVGSDEQNTTLEGVGKLIQRMVPDAEYIDSGQDGDRRNYRVDFSKIRTQLGYGARWTLEQGVQQVIDAIRSGAVVDYKDPMYSDVRFLTEGRAPWFAHTRKGWADQRLGGDLTRSSKRQADARLRRPQRVAGAEALRRQGQLQGQSRGRRQTRAGAERTQERGGGAPKAGA